MARRVAVLTNILPHYRVPLLRALTPLVGELRVFLSSRMEKDRRWPVFWDTLDVVVQRSFTWTRNFRNIHGYRDSSQIHVPYDTFFRLRQYRPDVIVSGEFGSRTLMSVLYRMIFPNTILIVWATLSEHTEATRGGLRNMLRRWIARHVDGAFVNGKSGAQYIAAIGFAGPVFTIPYVVDNAAFAAKKPIETDDTLRLMFVGQLIERKGLHQFLAVLLQWCTDHSDRSIQLRLVGDGPEREALQAVALPPNLTMEMVGDVAHNMLPSQYRTASIFVFPTLGDEWGTVVNEALSAGVPLLGSVFSQAVEELICDGKNGWTFKPSDMQDTYNTLNRALTTDPVTLHAMSQNARASMAGLTPAIVAARMAEAIHALAAQTQNSPKPAS